MAYWNSSVERILADINWMKKHGSKRGWDAMRRGNRAGGIIVLAIGGMFALGVLGLIIWGIQNLVASGDFAWQFILFNPITFILLIIGWAWSKCKY